MSQTFQGIPIPEGKEKRSLYHSAYRTIITYVMPLSELAAELKTIVGNNGCTIKNDERRNFAGKLDIILKDEAVVHVMMDACGTVGALTVTQLKFWVDVRGASRTRASALELAPTWRLRRAVLGARPLTSHVLRATGARYEREGGSLRGRQYACRDVRCYVFYAASPRAAFRVLCTQMSPARTRRRRPGPRRCRSPQLRRVAQRHVSSGRTFCSWKTIRRELLTVHECAPELHLDTRPSRHAMLHADARTDTRRSGALLEHPVGGTSIKQGRSDCSV